MKRKIVSVKLSEAEVKKIRSMAKEGENFSVTMRRLMLDGLKNEKATSQEQANILSQIEKIALEKETVEKKMDLMTEKMDGIFRILVKELEAIAEKTAGGYPGKDWISEIEETLAMFRIVLQWLVSGSPSTMAEVRKNPAIAEFLS